MVKYNFNIVNEDFDFGKVTKLAKHRFEDEIDNSMKDSLLSLMSPAGVIKDMLYVKKLFGFKEINVDALNRKSYEVIVKDNEHGAVAEIKLKLKNNGWIFIDRAALDTYFADDYILKGEEILDITNRRIKELKDRLVNEANKPSRSVFRKSIEEATEKLNNYAALTTILDKNDKLRSFIIDVINYVHYAVATSSYRVKLWISPDNGILYVESFLGYHGYKFAFILTGLVTYKSAVSAINNDNSNKQDKREELTLRRICAHYRVKIPAMAMHAERIDGHMVLKTSYNYKIVNNDYEFIGRPNEISKIIDARWFRTTYDDRSKVLPPTWYNPEGEVIKCYRASGDTQDDTAGLIVWFEIIPNETGLSGICNAYIGLTGDITYDSKTGKPLYNNILNISY